MKARMASPPQILLRLSEPAARSTSMDGSTSYHYEPEKNCQNKESHLHVRALPSSNPEISSLKSELSTIKNEVTKLLEQGPLRKSFLKNVREANLKRSLENGVSSLSPIKDVKTIQSHSEQTRSEFSSTSALSLEQVNNQLRLSLKRQSILLGEQRKLSQKIIQLHEQNLNLKQKLNSQVPSSQGSSNQGSKFQQSHISVQTCKGYSENIASLQAHCCNLSMGEVLNLNIQLASRLARFQIERQKQRKQMDMKVEKIKQKFNKYLSELKIKFEMELKAYQRQKASEACKQKSINELQKLKSQIRVKQKVIARLVGEKSDFQHRLNESEANVKQLRVLIQQINESLMQKQAKQLSLRFSYLE